MRRVPAVLLVPLLLLPACSGGDDAPSGKAAYVKAAEASCAKANAARKALQTPASTEAIPGYVRQLVTIASDATAELSALDPPAQDADALQAKFLGPLQQQVQDGQAFAKQVEAAGAKKDSAAVLRLLAKAPLQTTADLDFLRSYGFSACVEAADTSGAAGG